MVDAHAIAPLGYNKEHMEVKVQAHVAYQIRYHVVWISKRRKKILTTGIKEYVDKTIRTVVIDRYPDVYVHELNIQEDHVHALLEIPPKYCVSTVIGYIKGTTSRLVRMHIETLRHARELWGDGFYISTIGLNENMVRKYIQYQDKQERGQATLDSA